MKAAKQNLKHRRRLHKIKAIGKKHIRRLLITDLVIRNRSQKFTSRDFVMPNNEQSSSRSATTNWNNGKSLPIKIERRSETATSENADSNSD